MHALRVGREQIVDILSIADAPSGPNFADREVCQRGRIGQIGSTTLPQPQPQTIGPGHDLFQTIFPSFGA
jgi:hypothetical protein